MYVFMGFPSGKKPICNAGDTGETQVQFLSQIPCRRAYQPTQYPCLENSMDRGPWRAIQSMGQRVDRIEQLTQIVSQVFTSSYLSRKPVK